MDKYYTPDISEFHAGFEFEEESISRLMYHNKMFRFNWFDLQKEIITGIDDKKIRVKYLDKEDIESLGWKGQESNSVYFTKDNYRLVHWITSDGRDINIFEKYDGGTQEECLIRKAKVKNKSELKKLLKQLEIE